MRTLISNALIVNENRKFIGSVIISENRISEIYESADTFPKNVFYDETVDASGLLLFAGAIDAHVHFREPGMMQKATIASESRAAAAGGITSFMEMPNTVPQTTTAELLEQKCEIAAKTSLVNYAFYFGTSNNNFDEIRKLKRGQACGIKVFMGASTGNMLVDNDETLHRIFAESQMLVAVHAEDETIVAQNRVKYKSLFGENIPVKYHPQIRSADACYRATAKAVELAEKYGARLHVAHLSTEKELALFDNKPLTDKKITAEACVHHLWFCDEDYETLGSLIKCNPAIKTAADREALRKAVISGKIDIIATDHAPHLLSDKQGDALTAASGIPLIQHSLAAILELVQQKIFTYELVAEKMCHFPALLFGVKDRGFVRKNYFADLTLVKPDANWTVKPENILYKCAWSPFENETFSHQVVATWVNGRKVFDSGKFDENVKGERLMFEI